jgi:hypothetical protein
MILNPLSYYLLLFYAYQLFYEVFEDVVAIFKIELIQLLDIS